MSPAASRWLPIVRRNKSPAGVIVPAGFRLMRLMGRGLIRGMNQDEERELRVQLARLQQEHRDLDVAIEALHNVPGSDLLQVQRLKKRKLVLRDRITFVEDQLTPDIIA